MSIITVKYFDPISYAQQLCNAGFSREQADIQAQAIENVMNTVNEVTTTNELITKTDLIATVNELELKLIKWLLTTVLGTGFAIIIAIASLIKYIH